MNFVLHSEYQPTGDQPQAIKQLVDGFKAGNQCETLLGVTGSGKTFTMANVIKELNKPTLVLAHNKTLAAQLFAELKNSFRRTRLSILYPTTIIISPKRISLRPTHISKKIRQ